MTLNKKFGIIGGDIRQIYLAQKLKKEGYEVKIAGLENIPQEIKNIQTSDVLGTLKDSDYIIFPVPVSRDNQNINAPFSTYSIPINESLFSKLEKKVVFGGIISPLISGVNNSNFNLKDYYSREDFMVLNAIPTAEGAIKILLNESKRTIFGSKCMVVGYGRIGKVISKLLKSMGADVTISCRNIRDISWAKLENFNVIDISKCREKLNFDFVLNTVPAIVLNYDNLKLLNHNTTIIDVASAPGGVNKEDAQKLKIKIIEALGLPGKYFTESAGEIIAQTILKIIKEENL